MKLPWVKTAYWRLDADGKSWLGRGDVQLTWKSNYEKMSILTGSDLVADPDLALDPAVSPKILFEGMLTGASDRGIIEGIHPRPVKLIFLSDEAKRKVLDLHENPFQKAFLVDVDARTVGGKPALSRIVKVKDVLDLSQPAGPTMMHSDRHSAAATLLKTLNLLPAARAAVPKRPHCNFLIVFLNMFVRDASNKFLPLRKRHALLPISL